MVVGRSRQMLVEVALLAAVLLAGGCGDDGGADARAAPAASTIPRAAPSATGAQYDLPPPSASGRAETTEAQEEKDDGAPVDGTEM
ncbi:MAG: hypothetical protein AAGN82_30660 [Myxococcota bacterium]